MKEILLTDPFTGIDFTACKHEDKLYATHPLTGETIILDYDKAKKSFMVPVESFKHVDALSITDAANEFYTTRQNVSRACKTGKLPFKKLPNGAKVILRTDMRRYIETAQVGRPRKKD